MTTAASPVTQASQSELSRKPGRSVAIWLSALAAILLGLLLGLPSGVAEPLQEVLAWTLIAMLAIFAVTSVVKVLEHLLDCESS